jgi:hypothetical protein
LEVIEESNKLLVSIYYSIRDLDLLISLGILPNPVSCFSRKTSPCAKGISKLIIFGGSMCRFGNSIRCFLIGPIIAISIKVCLPCGMITGFVIIIHSTVLCATAIMILIAPMICFSIGSNCSSFLVKHHSASV